ncbi:SNF2 family N-terminal domain-containing protein [Fibrobacter sp. UWB15]|nr:SNF2 domain-containing protein [Fibrobacter sp. UWB6]SHG57175.1 SNF2 family N-terminal domain-containing protein [Fibrobacter sp. UWB8]SMG42252.1 SNF2 family N-terminal domain-containing protein [Fibrobacter sp. UWB15]
MQDWRTGTIVNTRGRDWIVLPSEDKNLLRLKALDGGEDDCIGIYLPLNVERDAVTAAHFGLPSEKDLGNVRSAKLLYDASRLTLRNAAGPFRCAAKLGFRPRSYQMVPLIMALKQEGPIRLMIADDVGIGKTIESLLIVKELIERRDIKRFAVLCPPHLCEQWQTELKDKFNIDAVIIRGSTQAALEKAKPDDDNSIFKHYPYQIVSIDYIKFDNNSKKSRFILDAPELLIVDEAHTCAKPAGAFKNQQLRYSVLSELAKPEYKRHVILMTATPHSGKDEEFKSLLGILNPKFEEDEWFKSDSVKKELAKFFVQRKRGNITKWLDENTPFPKRSQIDHDQSYTLSQPYQKLYDEVLQMASDMMQNVSGTKNQRFRYWTALAFLRGIMSSPAAGAKMFSRKVNDILDEDDGVDDSIEHENPLFEKLDASNDELPTSLASRAQLKSEQKTKFESFVAELERLKGFEKDYKLLGCSEIVKQWIKQGVSPVIFCRYIETAHYVEENLREKFGNKVHIECITSELPDDDRKERVRQMMPEEGDKKPRILVATDCLSEGINLQDIFDAVFHYDLPWNPNRLEQREGRVDRFGQIRTEVHTCMFYGKDNPMDQTVLKVLFEKAKRIKGSIGVSISFPENSKEFMDAIFKAILNDAKKKKDASGQLSLFDLDEFKYANTGMDKYFEETVKKEEVLRSMLAQESIHAQEIEEDLKRSDESVGNPEVVYSFVHDVMQDIYAKNSKMNDEQCILNFAGLEIPDTLKNFFKKRTSISFKAPVPEGTTYWGRNSEAVERLCEKVLADATHHQEDSRFAARAAVVKSKNVNERTVIYLLRARHVIKDLKLDGSNMVAEEILTRGYRTVSKSILTKEEVSDLMKNPAPAGDLSPEIQQRQLQRELDTIGEKQADFDAFAKERAELLIQEHERYYKALGEKRKSDRFKVVEPVIPLDVLGIYIFVPEAQ